MAATTPTFDSCTTSHSPLFKLPPELRNEVYTYILSDLPTKVTLPLIRSSTSIQNANKIPHPALSILLVCRQIHSEARLMAWSLVSANLFSLTQEAPEWEHLSSVLGEVNSKGASNTFSPTKEKESHVTKEAALLRQTMGTVLPHLTSLEINNREVFETLRSSPHFFSGAESAAVAISRLLIRLETITLSKAFNYTFELASMPHFDHDDDEEGLQLDDSPWAWCGAFEKFHLLFPKVKEVVVNEEGEGDGLGKEKLRVKTFFVREGELYHGDTGNAVYRKG